MRASQRVAIAYRRPFAYDPSRSQTVLLAPFDDSNTTRDIGPGAKTLTTGGAVTSSHARIRWGVTSFLFNLIGAADRVTAAASSDWQFGTGQFQIRMSVYLESTATDLELLAHRQNADLNNFWLIRKTSTNTIRVFAKTSGVTGTDISTSSAFPVGGNAWHDLEIRRGSDGLVAILIDGVVQSLSTTANTVSFGWPAPSGCLLTIGNGDDNYANGFKGNMQWLRIKKGIAPTAEYRQYPPKGRYPIPAY